MIKAEFVDNNYGTYELEVNGSTISLSLRGYHKVYGNTEDDAVYTTRTIEMSHESFSKIVRLVNATKSVLDEEDNY